MLKDFLNNLKGEGRIISIWWFLVLVIVGVGIVAGVMIFFSAEADVRGLESEILYDRIYDCLVEDGFILQEIAEGNSIDVFEKCDLDKKVFELNEGVWFFRINFSNVDEENILVGEFGKKGFLKDCEMQIKNSEGEKVEAKSLGQCYYDEKRVLYYFYSENGVKISEGKLKILAASNQEGKQTTLENK